MKIIKPVLLGPKLIAVGPLKCFKGGGSSGGGGGGGSSSGGGKGGGGGSGSGGSSGGDKGGSGSSGGGETPQQRESRLKKEEMDKKAAEQKRRDEQAAKERDDRQKAVREREIKRQAEIKKQQEAQEKQAKAIRDKTKREQESTEQASGFFDKLGTGLKGLSYGKFTTNKREVEQEEKSYNRARKTQGINEARRLGRPVAVDGLVYKPGMQTPEEAENESVEAAKAGYDSVDQYRQEMAAEGSVEDKVRAKQRQMLEEKAAMDRGVDPTQLIEEKEEAKVRAQERAKQDQERALQEQMDLELEDEGTLEEKVRAKQKLIADETKAVETKRQDMNFLRGAISAEEYEKRTGFAPRKELRDQIVAGRNLPKALAGIAGFTKFKAGAPAIKKIAEFGQRKLTPEVSFAEANQALIEQKAKADAPKAAPVDPRDEQPQTVQQAQRDPSLRPFVPRTGESKSTPAPVVAAAPAPAPEPKPEPKPV